MPTTIILLILNIFWIVFEPDYPFIYINWFFVGVFSWMLVTEFIDFFGE